MYGVLGSEIHAYANTFLGLKQLAHFDMRTALSLGVGGKSFSCAATPGELNWVEQLCSKVPEAA